MAAKHLTLDGLEAATPILSRRADDAAPCKLLGVIRHKPSTKLLDRLVDEIDTGSLSGLAIFDVPDVSFLARFPSLRYLELRPTAKIDLSPLAGLGNLRGLHLENPGSAVDFAAFPLLEEFVGDWHPKNTGLPHQSLRELRIWRYKPGSVDLREFESLTRLTSLSLIQTNITSLSGIAHLEDLRRLLVAYAPKVTSLDALGDPALGIRELELDRLKNVEAYDPLAQLPYLKQLKLSACAPMADLHWIARHPRLAFFAFVDTDVASGDLTPLLTIPNLRYVGTLDKRNYSHKCDVLNRMLQDPR